VQTNQRNHLLYSQDKTCQLCLSDEENFTRVLQCLGAQAVDTRSLALTHLTATLSKLRTPQQIVAAIQNGTHHWIASSDPHQVRALTKGSMLLGDIYLTVAFTKQYHSIGWHQLCLGRVSSSWEKAYQAYSRRCLYNIPVGAYASNMAPKELTDTWNRRIPSSADT
jgi:hypothetical protein